VIPTAHHRVARPVCHCGERAVTRQCRRIRSPGEERRM